MQFIATTNRIFNSCTTTFSVKSHFFSYISIQHLHFFKFFIVPYDLAVQPPVQKLYYTEDTSFTCASSFRPHWFLMRNELTKLTSRENTLEIEYVNSEDSGSYYCYGFHDVHNSYFIAKARLKIYGEHADYID